MSCGRAAGVEEADHRLIAELCMRLDGLRAEITLLPRPHVLVLEWLSPLMVARHWTAALLRIVCGAQILGHDGQPTGPSTGRPSWRSGPR